MDCGLCSNSGRSSTSVIRLSPMRKCPGVKAVKAIVGIGAISCSKVFKLNLKHRPHMRDALPDVERY